ncbi:DUF4350 domain-containing protein, partial [Ornithinicoccus halotolerans]|uniref:DUF4350 domain-containing protein n=1 Tax=Ornithinicoccus halotolerans TaxID=1748220 RepID=UPI0018864758
MSRRLLLWVGVVLAVAIAGALATGLAGPVSRPLDPSNPDDDGLRALAQVLAEHGVQVEVVRGAGSVGAADVGAGTTVLLESTELLSGERARGLLRASAGADRLVVLQPHARVGELLDLPVRGRQRATDEPLAAHCELGGWRSGDTIVGASVLLEVEAGAGEQDAAGEGGSVGTDVTVCLPPSASFDQGGRSAGYLLGFPAVADRPETLLLGFAPALTNARVTEAANAAAGLRLLGGSPRLLWVVPTPADGGGEDPQSLLDVLPRAVAPSVVVLLLALGALALWRGRRLGPLATEPLPVVVRAAETVRSRGRLYRRGRDRGHALR